MKVPSLLYIQMPKSILDPKPGCLRDHMIFLAIIRNMLEQQEKCLLFSGKQQKQTSLRLSRFFSTSKQVSKQHVLKQSWLPYFPLLTTQSQPYIRWHIMWFFGQIFIKYNEMSPNTVVVSVVNLQKTQYKIGHRNFPSKFSRFLIHSFIKCSVSLCLLRH